MGKIAEAALDYAISKIGSRYSQEDRMKENVYDCSSLIYRAYKDAGYTYKTEYNTSMFLVYDTGFDLLYPSSDNAIGKKFTSVASLKKQGYVPRAGDVIYINTISSTTRHNKITHVVMVENETSIVHARSTKYGVCRNSIDLYGSKIVAVTRFIEESDHMDKNVRAASCTGNSVNIRKSPEGQIIGSINKMHPIVVYGSGTWLRCVTLDKDSSLDGYIHSNYVS